MHKDNNENLIFETQNIQFFPEDIEKMKTMNEDEIIEFKSVLKRERRYIVL